MIKKIVSFSMFFFINSVKIFLRQLGKGKTFPFFFQYILR